MLINPNYIWINCDQSIYYYYLCHKNIIDL